jgi:hypothetical protein
METSSAVTGIVIRLFGTGGGLRLDVLPTAALEDFFTCTKHRVTG